VFAQRLETPNAERKRAEARNRKRKEEEEKMLKRSINVKDDGLANVRTPKPR
jgi:hypothetical protein